MRGDFSRKTHRPDRHYSRVLLQQGRVLLDADWNEQTAIQLQAMRTMMSDLIGPHGGPSDALAFMVEASPSELGKLVLSVRNGFAGRKDLEPRGDNRLRFQERNLGRYYVDGILIEHDLSRADDGALFVETDIDARNDSFVVVYLEVWEQHVTWIEENKPFKQRSMREIALGGPDTCSRSQVRWAIKTELIPTRTNELLGRLSEANANEVNVEELAKVVQLWERRRFRALDRFGLRMAAGLTTQDIGAGDPCRDTAVARYRGPENRLYRVEIHSIVDDVPAFKWSRENGSVVFPIAVDEPITFDEGELTLALRVSSDPRFGLDKGDIVELVTETLDAAGQAGPLFEVESVDPTATTVSLRAIDKRTIELPLEKWALLRRWDQFLDSKRSNGAPAQMRDGAIVIDGRDEFVLEDGIVVRFLLPDLSKKAEAPVQPAPAPAPTQPLSLSREVSERELDVVAVEGERARALTHGFGTVSLEPTPEKAPPSCRVGDYWLIPARTIPGDVEWPKIDESMEAFELPHGVDRHYAPLATVRVQDGNIRVDDLRRSFTGLAG